MSKTKWYTKPIRRCELKLRAKRRGSVAILVALALVLSLGIAALPMAGVVEASPGTIQVDVNDAGCVASPQGDPYSVVYCSIQDAIDDATGGDTINVAAGTYSEYIHITTDDLTIEGAGIDQSIIDLEGLIPYWHYSPNKSFASRAGVLITGYGSPDEIIEGVTFRGFTVKNAGLNPPITATGTHTGANNTAVLTDSSASWETDELVGQWLHNVSDKLVKIDIEGNTPIRSYGEITANTATTVTATLAGGLDNDWDAGDTYVVMPYEQYVDVAEDLQDDVRGIGIANGKDILIQYCKVINSGYGGITAGYARLVSAHKYSEGVTIDHCVSSDHPQVGISVGDYLGSVTITNNTCSNNKRPHPTDPSREYAGVGIQVSGKKGGSPPISGVISDNICSNNGFEGIVLKKYADGVIVEDNTVTGHNLDEDGAGIFFYGDKSNPVNCQNNIIRNNTVTGNIRGIVAYYAQACTIEGNTITTDAGAFASGQAAIKIDGGNNIAVKDNTISCDGVGIKVQQTWNNVDCYENTFTGNTITGAKFAGIFISHGAHDNTFTGNTITGTTMLTRWAGKEYEETQGDGVFIWGQEFTGYYGPYPACTDNVFHWNNIYGNAGDGMENQVTTTTVNAKDNWWGADNGPGGVGPGTGDEVSDYVDYDPWLTHPFVKNIDTGETFCSIQAAIDDSDTDAGDTITVAAGTYNERVNINKSLTLEGANAGIPATEVRGPESIINPQGLGLDFGVLIDGAGTTATIDGFTVENYKRAGILAGAFSLENDPAVVHILNNIVTEPIGQQNNNCIQVGDGTTGTIIGNEVSGANLESPDWSGSGILVAGSSDVLVSDNYVHNSEGGIQILGYAEYRGGAAAENNVIENNLVEGNGCGISVQGNSIGTIIRYNDVLNNDTGIGSLAYDFSYDQSTPSGTEIHYNNIVGNENYGVASSVWWHHTGDVLAEEVDARYNWWGDVTGPEHATLNPGAKGNAVSDNVDFSPWLYETQENFIPGAPCYAGSVVLENEATEVEPGSYAGGWNTFSTPILLDSLADTWGELDNNLPTGYVAYRFDSVAQKWETIATDTDYEVKPGEGFFIQISSKSSIPILCSTVLLPPQSRDLSSDWNLVGAPSYKSKVVEDGLIHLAPTYTVVSSPGANPASWSYPPADSKKLLPGRAYWVAMSAGKTLKCFEGTPVADDMIWGLNQPD